MSLVAPAMPNPTVQKNRAIHRGFSLVELMVVIAVAALLMSLGMPSFSKFILGQRVKTASYDLAISLLVARSEAVKRNVDVVVSPTVTANGWAGGWRVTYGVAATLLSEQSAYSGLSISGPAANSITYQGSSGRPSAGTKLYFTISGGEAARCVSVDVSGMTQTKVGVCT